LSGALRGFEPLSYIHQRQTIGEENASIKSGENPPSCAYEPFLYLSLNNLSCSSPVEFFTDFYHGFLFILSHANFVVLCKVQNPLDM
tara:strand:+ start:343 stop:603 length:261 start_codon:yes stop_codon:yes gene_type:complete